MIINPYRFAAAGDTLPEPIHWWNLNNVDSVDSGDGLYDLGTKRVDSGWDLTNVSCTTSATGGLNSQSVVDMSDSSYLHRSADKAWDGDSSTNISVSCWARMDAISTTGNWLWSWRENTTDRLTHGLFFNTTPNDFSSSQVWDAGGDTVNANDPTEVAATSTWYHLAMTWDGTTIRHYIDGVEFGTGTNASVGAFTTNAMPFALGGSSWSKGASILGHDGQMGATGIWDVELSATEVSTLYGSGTTDGYYADYTFV